MVCKLSKRLSTFLLPLPLREKDPCFYPTKISTSPLRCISTIVFNKGRFLLTLQCGFIFIYSALTLSRKLTQSYPYNWPSKYLCFVYLWLLTQRFQKIWGRSYILRHLLSLLAFPIKIYVAYPGIERSPGFYWIRVICYAQVGIIFITKKTFF